MPTSPNGLSKVRPHEGLVKAKVKSGEGAGEDLARAPLLAYSGGMLNLPLLSATLRDCGHKLPRTDNLGKSGDWRDLYYLTDYLTFALDRAYPSQPCGAGCSLCCRENSVFRVSVAEWEVLEALLREWDAEDASPDPASPDPAALDPAGLDPGAPGNSEAQSGESRVDRLLARNQALYGEHFEQLERVAEHWERHPAPGEANPHLDGLPSLCPALEADRCSVYDARPLVCRAYGYFAYNVRGSETLLICRTYGKGFLDSLKEQGLENAPLPNFEPFDRQARRLNSTLVARPLPLWLRDWAQLRASL